MDKGKSRRRLVKYYLTKMGIPVLFGDRLLTYTNRRKALRDVRLRDDKELKVVKIDYADKKIMALIGD